MSLTIAKLAAETRRIVWRTHGEEVAITYRPAALTQGWISKTAAEALAACVVSLDILGDDGKPIPLDAESLAATLSEPILKTINTEIWRDASVDPTTAGTSGRS